MTQKKKIMSCYSETAAVEKLSKRMDGLFVFCNTSFMYKN